MDKFIKLFAGVVLLCITTGSCSNDETTETYDEFLSNTVWIQSNTDDDGDGSTISPGADIFDEYYKLMFKKLEYTLLSQEERIDTVWEFNEKTHYYILKFKNKTCELKDMYLKKGTYYLKKNQVETRHYQNQTVSGYWGKKYMELTICNDSAIFTYQGDFLDAQGNFYDTRTEKFFFGKDNTIEEIVNSTHVSDEYPGVKEDTKQYDMTFTRNGFNVELNGDIHLVGVISPEGDEIEFNMLGTLYKSTIKDTKIQFH